MKICTYIIYIIFILQCWASAQASYLSSSDLPIVIIDTHQQIIQDQLRIVADMGIIDNNGERNHINDIFNNYNGKIAIETRGSSSATYPKKQYRFETQDTGGNNLNVSLMGLPQENDWILYGPYDDQSLIRNALAYKIARGMGQYASRTRFCELILNEDYQGLYVLMETIKRDKNRVDIATLNDTDISGDQLTGGYIIKVDKIEGESTEHWYGPFGTQYQYHYPKFEDIQNEQMDYIKNYIASFENLMNSYDFNNPQSGYSQVLDIPSFVDHFIINEFAKNVDAYRISAFLYKDKDSNNGKLNAGPVWDFNLSFGKAWFSEDLFQTHGWQVYYSQRRPWDGFKVPFWWEKLVQDYNFESAAVARWQYLRQNLLSQENIFYMIDSLVTETAEARQRNFERWPDVENDHSYEFEILQLKSWIIARTNWIDNNLDLLTSLPQSRPAGPVFQFIQNYPNPFNSTTNLRIVLSGPAQVSLKIFSTDGKEIRTLLNKRLNAGLHNVPWDSKDESQNPVSSGVYYCRMVSDRYSETQKLILIK